MIYIYISVHVQKSKRKGAFQIKLALGTVHFHALQRARINEAEDNLEKGTAPIDIQKRSM